MPRMQTEFEIDRWAEIFRSNHLSHRSAGLTLEQFLQQPESLLQALIYDQALPLADDEEFYPLLPGQRAVQARVAAVESLDTIAETMEAQLTARTDARLAGDHYVEPTHHHSYAVSRARPVSRET